MIIDELPLSVSSTRPGGRGWTLAVHVDGVSTGVVKKAGEEMCRISVTGNLDQETARDRLKTKALRWVTAYLARQRSKRGP